MTEEIVLGGYRRVNVLQTGQTSEVWEVVEATGNQRFAMKLLLPEKAGIGSERKLLFHEAKIGLKLEHPKIIKFFSYSSDKHNPFILMEYFPSQNLKLRIMRGQFQEFIKPKFRKLVEQMILSLDYLHSLGWVHRDVKPDNYLVSKGGDVRLIDFALAIRAATSLTRLFARKNTRIMGTRSYMSPEQIRGLPLDRRADIYSFGVMLYEMVHGRLPYVASSGQELLKKHITAAVPAFDRDKNVTSEFEALVASMMAKKEADRPATLSAVLEQIRGMKIFKDESAADQAADGAGKRPGEQRGKRNG
ncbi:MAG: serine/threonine-protein kinase [Planctomycetota bacterium]